MREFLAECAETLAVLGEEVARLERRPDDPAPIDGMLRALHTIKGSCGFLGLRRLEGLAHAAETLLGRLRDGGPEAMPDAIGLIRALLLRIEAILSALASAGAEPPGEDGDLLAELDLLAGAAQPAPVTAPTSGASSAGRSRSACPAATPCSTGRRLIRCATA